MVQNAVNEIMKEKLDKRISSKVVPHSIYENKNLEEEKIDADM